MKPILALTLVFCTIGAGTSPTTPAAWNRAVRDRVLTQIETNLQDYFFVDRLPSIRAAIESARTRLDAITDPGTFATETTAILYAVTHDKHVVVRYARDPLPTTGGENTAALQKFDNYVNHGFEAMARLDGNIGYLRIFGFAPFSPSARKMFDSAMAELANTDAIIIDLRDNHGGSKESVDYFLGYFFDRKTQVTGVLRRSGSSVIFHPAFAATELGGAPYVNKPVYVITSSETISGAEQFAYDMQVEKRATIVGATTAGGANPGGMRELSEHFRLFVPTGSGRNPVTNTNWEGIGVLPDTRTSPQGALLEAYTEALRSARNDAGYAVEERADALQNPAQALEDSFFIH